ncbi:MAG: sigma-70 family RNA polymerase sigma factor [Planctomycetota bacterium]
MTGKEDSVFQEFKKHYTDHGGSTGSNAEEEFIQRLVPRVSRMARKQLSDDVRRAFDTNDITSTVLRRVVSRVRSGKIRLESEGQFMSLLKSMTRNAIVDKFKYLNSLLRDHNRNRSMDQAASNDNEESKWDLSSADDHRDAYDSEPLTPVDDVLLAERTQALNELCNNVRKQLEPKEWHFFKRRFIEEATWSSVADEHGLSSADAARMKGKRLIEALREKLREYEEWLADRPDNR